MLDNPASAPTILWGISRIEACRRPEAREPLQCKQIHTECIFIHKIADPKRPPGRLSCEKLNIFLHDERVSKSTKSSSLENTEKCALCENLSDFCKSLMYNITVNIVITFL